LAGQPIAIEVSSSPSDQDDGLYFVHTDHLGSISAMSDEFGDLTGNVVRFEPFGAYRPGSGPDDITDRGFTGHRHNDGLGLVYMNARYYVGSIGRFASADTIVPDLTNPQSLNRYSYTRNNPIKRIDPTGNKEEDCVYLDCEPEPLPEPEEPLIVFDGIATEEWKEAEKRAIREGAWDLALALAREINRLRFKESRGARGLGESDYSPISPREAFLLVFGGSVTFYKTGTFCGSTDGCFGENVGNNKINVYRDIYDDNGSSRIPGANTSNRWAVHELAHALEARINRVLGDSHVRNEIPNALLNNDGFAGPFPGWRQSRTNDSWEIFADMVVGWTYGEWETNPQTGLLTDEAGIKADYMTTNMSTWIDAVR
jgi:RHS repeat-associated protein